MELTFKNNSEYKQEIGMITDPQTGSNCYVIQADGHAIIIDPGNYELLQQYLKSHHLEPEYILLTHEHCDHIHGLEELRKHYKNAPVISSSACSRGIQNSKLNMSSIMELFLYYQHGEQTLFTYPPFQCRPADITFDSDSSIPFHGALLNSTLVPGHSHGSICISCNKNILFTGDYLLPGEKIITRFPSGSTEEFQASGLPYLRSISVGTQIFPGHGKPYVFFNKHRKFYDLV